MNLRPVGAGLAILTYHAIDPRLSVTATDPSWFAETLDQLLGSGHHAVDLEDWISQGRPETPKGFAIAFDDGLRSILRVTSLFAERSLPSTVFLATGRVGLDNDWPGQPSAVAIEPILTWSEIRSLASIGVRFAAHGVTHPRLDRLSPGRVERELIDSRSEIEDRLGRPCRLLAYPYGISTPSARQAASKHFLAAFGTRLDYARRRQDPFNLARIDAYYLRSHKALASLVAGRAEGWLRWRRALRAVRSSTVPALGRPG